jgi:hypothetical protein
MARASGGIVGSAERRATVRGERRSGGAVASSYVFKQAPVPVTNATSITFANPITAGSLLVVSTAIYAQTATAVSDTVNGTWGSGVASVTNSDNVTQQMFLLPNSAAGTDTVNVTWSGAAGLIAAAEYASVATSSPLDPTTPNPATASGNSSTAVAVGPTGTLAAAGELLLFCVWANGGDPITAGSGYIERANSAGMMVADKAAPTTSGQTATATLATAADWTAILAAIKL